MYISAYELCSPLYIIMLCVSDIELNKSLLKDMGEEKYKKNNYFYISITELIILITYISITYTIYYDSKESSC